MQIDQISLDRLSVSKANMRAGKKPPDVTDILPSVIRRGVISPLFVRPNCQDGHFEIVAGKRRYFASLEAAKQGQDDLSPPCIVIACLGFDPERETVANCTFSRSAIGPLVERLLELPDAVVMEIGAVVMAKRWRAPAN